MVSELKRRSPDGIRGRRGTATMSRVLAPGDGVELRATSGKDVSRVLFQNGFRDAAIRRRGSIVIDVEARGFQIGDSLSFDTPCQMGFIRRRAGAEAGGRNALTNHPVRCRIEHRRCDRCAWTLH